MRSAHIEYIVSRLESSLSKLDLSNQAGIKSEGTKRISIAVVEFAKREKLTCNAEVHLGCIRTKCGRKGFVDFVLSSDENKFAIEIDSTNKKWSLEKLSHAQTCGYVPIWVRWRARITIPIPDDIIVIDLVRCSPSAPMAQDWCCE